MTSTPFSSMAWIFLCGFVGSFGAVFLKSGASRLQMNLKSIVTNWRLAFGIGMYLLSSVFFVFGIRKGELSVLYPLVALGYMWTVVWSRVFFGEPLTRSKFVAVGLILVGIAFLGLGSQK
jgi:multidrug transporter EmrE-like cation transporter